MQKCFVRSLRRVFAAAIKAPLPLVNATCATYLLRGARRCPRCFRPGVSKLRRHRLRKPCCDVPYGGVLAVFRTKRLLLCFFRAPNRWVWRSGIRRPETASGLTLSRAQHFCRLALFLFPFQYLFHLMPLYKKPPDWGAFLTGSRSHKGSAESVGETNHLKHFVISQGCQQSSHIDLLR
jgi:hypothetical protein